ncbi:MAG: hypothetical protein ACPHXR_09310 [Flavicella sp.]
MKKQNGILTTIVLLFTLSTLAQNVHSIIYLAVPKANTQEFMYLHKKFTDLSAGEDRTLLHTWLFNHARGGDYSMMIVDVYPSQEAMHQDKPREVLKKNIEALNLTEEEEAAIKVEWKRYLSLYIEGHTDETRILIKPEEYLYSSDAFDPSKKMIVISALFDVKYSDMEEFTAIAHNAYTKLAIERGNATLIFQSSHLTGSGLSVEIVSFFPSWEAFAADEKVLHAGNPDMKEEWLRFFELMHGHYDEITILLGTNWQSKTFNFSK